MPLRDFIMLAENVLRTAVAPIATSAAHLARCLCSARFAPRISTVLPVLLALIFGGCEAPHHETAATLLVTSSLGEGAAADPQTCQSGWSRDIIRTKLRRKNAAFHPLMRAEPMHSAGDIVRLDISEGADFAGTYKVNLDGHINVPYAGRIAAAGQTTAGLMQSVKKRLIQKGLFHANHLDLSVIPMEWAPIQISVSGAVFQPGRGLTAYPKDKARENIQALGDSPPGRFLDAGLMIGGGVRPDADLSEIILSRYGKQYAIDLSGVLDGTPVPDISLMHGDHIEVLSTGCRQVALMRPSQVTPPVVRIFVSNLSVAISSNSEQHVAEVPYGSRLLDAAVVANCVGGTFLTNASRRIAYISTQGGLTDVKEYRVRNLLADPSDLAGNPYMMPNDALACFDSEVTNIRDVARSLTELLTTFGLITSLL